MPRRNTPPKYRLHKPSGLAVVTLDGKDRYLGRHGSRASRELYARLIAEREAAGGVPVTPRSDLAVLHVVLAYWRHTREQEKQHTCTKAALRILRESHGRVPVREFGPRALKAVRRRMIDEGWNRDTVNRRVRVIRRAFKWAVGEELAPVEVFQALATVEGLRKGELGVKEPQSVVPAPAAHVEAIRPHVSAQVWAIVEVMRYTGARCDEVCRLRPIDLDTTGKVWRATLGDHKTAHHGKTRTFWLGPRAQQAVQPFLSRAVASPLFSPIEAEEARRRDAAASRKTPASCGNTRGSNRADNPKRRPGERYTTASVRRAIHRACGAAGVPQWSPHQLRHLAATEYRKAGGLEVAAVILGHSSAAITDQIYAERDATLAEGVVLKHG